MRVNLRRRVSVVAALIVPAIAALALSASPAFASMPRYGRLLLGTHSTVSPFAVLTIALATATGLSLLVINERRRSRAQKAAVDAIAVAADPPAGADGRGRRAA